MILCQMLYAIMSNAFISIYIAQFFVCLENTFGNALLVVHVCFTNIGRNVYRIFGFLIVVVS